MMDYVLFLKLDRLEGLDPDSVDENNAAVSDIPPSLLHSSPLSSLFTPFYSILLCFTVFPLQLSGLFYSILLSPLRRL